MLKKKSNKVDTAAIIILIAIVIVIITIINTNNNDKNNIIIFLLVGGFFYGRGLLLVPFKKFGSRNIPECKQRSFPGKDRGWDRRYQDAHTKKNCR